MLKPSLTHQQLREALQQVVKEPNGGFALPMWASVVDRDGTVLLVTFSGADRGEQWPGSRMISAQKAYTGSRKSWNENSR